MWIALGWADPAFGIADDPAHGVAGRNGSGADELLAGLERDVGDLAWRGIDLIERAIGEGIDLDSVEVSGPGRLNACRAIGLLDTGVRVGRLRRRFRTTGSGLSCPGSGKGFGNSTICTGFGGSG